MPKTWPGPRTSDPHLVLVVPQALDCVEPGVMRLHAYPARYLFPLAERIVTACGFNAMAETAPYRPIHRFLPMPRALDDQHARAARVRGADWGSRPVFGAIWQERQ